MTEDYPRSPAGSVKRKRRAFRTRFFLLKFVFALSFIVIAARLFMIQAVEGRMYQGLARKQYEAKFVLPATRGTLSDRNGNVLVANSMFLSFAADPKIVGERGEEIATTFARVFGKPPAVYKEKLSGGQGAKRFVWLERRVAPDLAKRIEDAELEGVVVVNEPKRIYHYDDLAGTLIGFTDVDNRGISGLELELDDELKGMPGSAIMQRDGLGRVRPSADYPRVEPLNGKDVALTIDLAYQSIVEEELRRGIAANEADGGLAAMLNPKTGELLALAVWPSVNPNDLAGFDVAASRNRVVSDVFEPGSVFKVVTASAAYEYNLVSPDSRYNAEHGTMKIPVGRKFRLIRDSHEYDWLTFQEGIEYSSNIVMAKVSKLIGPERFYREARQYGFGTLTGIDLPGEVRGVLKRPNEWSGTTLQTISYGYEVGVTPLQILCAYAAVANHGVMMKPYVVAQVRDADGRIIRTARPMKVRDVVSERTVGLLEQAFLGVVERGTGKDVQIAGIHIAGKTGTARKYVEGKYASGSYTASFVGMFPLEDPQVVCVVMMDNPRTRGYYGGSTSGPVFRSIAQRIIGTSARFSTPAIAAGPERVQNTVIVPDVRMLQRSLAEKMLDGLDLKVQTFGNGEVVVKQSPPPGKKIEKGDAVSLVLNASSTMLTNGMLSMPDVRGMSVRRALSRLAIDEFEVSVQGNGVVVRQSPAAGAPAAPGSAVVLVCDARPVLHATVN